MTRERNSNEALAGFQDRKQPHLRAGERIRAEQVEEELS